MENQELEVLQEEKDLGVLITNTSLAIQSPGNDKQNSCE